MGKKIYINEEDVKTIVRRSLKKIIDEGCPSLAYNHFETEPLLEMARINKKETGDCIFPFDSWEVKIWSNDHHPSHFHVIKDGWNASFNIETGELLSLEARGKKQDVFQYMVKNVKIWLDSACAAQPKLTNKENAQLQWDQLHDN